jgi:hypothetical protein
MEKGRNFYVVCVCSVRVVVTNTGAWEMLASSMNTPIGVFLKGINLSKLIKSALLVTKLTIGTRP